VCDAGLGFRQSLESAPGRVRNDPWDDAAALEEAVIRGVSEGDPQKRGRCEPAGHSTRKTQRATHHAGSGSGFAALHGRGPQIRPDGLKCRGG